MDNEKLYIEKDYEFNDELDLKKELLYWYGEENIDKVIEKYLRGKEF